MRESKPNLEVMSVYDSKMLASRAELGLLRVMRQKRVERQDLRAFVRLAELLQSAAEGDSWVSGSGLVASSEHSLEVLRETLKAMINTFPEAEIFRKRLVELRNSAKMLSEGNVPSSRKLNDLLDFTHRYGLVQSEQLKVRHSSAPLEANAWAMLMRPQYSLTF